MENKIKNIIFDIGNVFLNFKPFEHFSHIENATTVAKKMFTHKTWTAYDKGVYTIDEVCDIYCELWQEDQELIRYLLTNWLEALTPIAYTFKKCEELKHAGYQVYLLSNLSKDAHEHIEATYDIFQMAHGYVLSYQEDCIKPDAKIYEILLNRYNLKADECLFLDDAKQNVEAAKELGIEAIQFIEPNQVEEALRKVLYAK